MASIPRTSTHLCTWTAVASYGESRCVGHHSMPACALQPEAMSDRPSGQVPLAVLPAFPTRRVLDDLQEDFGFRVGRWNQVREGEEALPCSISAVLCSQPTARDCHEWAGGEEGEGATIYPRGAPL
jgi:hypothetical protein